VKFLKPITLYFSLCILAFFFAEPAFSQTVPSKCFEITSILVDACGGSAEGENEMLTFMVGPNPINVNSIDIAPFVTGNANWGNTGSPFQGFCNISGTLLSKINQINTSITTVGNCGIMIPVNPGQQIPAKANTLLITSSNFNASAHDFSNLRDTLYVIIQCSGNTSGHFANSGTGTRRLIMLYGSNCSDTVTYDRSELLKVNQTKGAEDGSLVYFDFAGNATYANNGCKLPQAERSVKASYTAGNYCLGDTVPISAVLKGPTNILWLLKNSNSGSIINNQSVNTGFIANSSVPGTHTIYALQIGTCDTTRDSIQITIGSGNSSLSIGSDTVVCKSSKLKLTPQYSNIDSFFWSAATGTFSSSNTDTTTYTFNSNQNKAILILNGKGQCGTLQDSIKISALQLPELSADSLKTFCVNASVTLQANPKNASMLLWQGGLGNFNRTDSSTVVYTTSNQDLSSFYIGVSASNQCGTSKDSVLINLLPIPSVNASNDTDICLNAIVNLSPTAIAADTLIWSGGKGIFSKTGNIISYQSLSNDDTSFYLKITALNQCGAASDSLRIREKPQPLISNIIFSNELCLNNPASIKIQGSNYNTVLITHNGQGNLSQINTDSFRYSANATDNLVNFQMRLSHDCGFKDTSIQIKFRPKPNASFSMDTLFCEGDSIHTIVPLEGGGFLGGWQVDPVNFAINPATPGIGYVHHVIERFGCKDSFAQRVQVFALPDAEFEASEDNPFINQEILFWPKNQGLINLTWLVNDVIKSNADTLKAKFDKEGEAKITLIATNSRGCVDSFTKNTTILADDSFIVPNVFTPNGDSINDFFGAEAQGLKKYNMLISNRWGQIIFESNDVTLTWDGTYKGSLCPQGVYFVMIQAQSHREKTYHHNGTVTLLR
jgi:gliding motility-associated-like protein